MKAHGRVCIVPTALCVVAAFVVGGQQHPRPSLSPAVMGVDHLLEDQGLQALGKKLFFDADLSTPPGQSCAACHSPEVGWTGPDEALNKKGSVYPGAIHSRFGNRKPNASAYATLTPNFHALREGDELTRRAAAQSLGRLGGPAATAALLRTLRQPPSALVQDEAFQALAHIAQAGGVRFVVPSGN